MRPVTLTLCAWGPYPERVTVDFTKFSEGSVFLVTGPTGAGKTTIFDAICYALYGNVSGNNREKTTLRSDFAEPELDTYVELTFTHKDKQYVIRRSPKYDRPKKRGDGFTTSPESAELTVKGETPIASVQDVNAKIEEIMGINYKQFKQIAMIAQGEFLNLLFAKSDEKVAIFRNLFKTELYDKILRSLIEKTKKIEGEINTLTNKIDEAVASIETQENEEFEAEINTNHRNYERILFLLEEEIKQMQEEMKKLKQQADKITVSYTKQANEITLAMEINRDLGLLQETNQKLLELKSKEEAMNIMETEVLLARKAQEVDGTQQLYQEKEQQVKDWEQRVEETKQALTEIQEQSKTFEVEISKAKERESEILESQKKVQWLESLVPVFETLTKTEQENTKKKKQLNESIAEEEKRKEIQDELKEKRVNTTALLKNYETVEKDLWEVNTKGKEINENFKKLNGIKKLYTDLEEIEGELKKAQEQYQVEEEKRKQMKERLELKEQLFRNAAIGIAAKYLVDNQPCPVCGSLNHPHKAQVSEDVPDEKEIEKARKEQEHQESIFQAIYGKATQIKAKQEAKIEEIKLAGSEFEIETKEQLVEQMQSIQDEGTCLKKRKSELEELNRKRENYQKQLLEMEARIEENDTNLEKIRQIRTQLQSDWDNLNGQIANLRLQLPKEYESQTVLVKDLSAERMKLTKLQEEQKSVQEKKEKLIATQKSQESLLASHQKSLMQTMSSREEKKAEYEAARKQAGFLEEKDYLAAKQPSQIIKQKEQIMKNYREQVTSCEERRKHLESRVDGKEEKDIDAMKEKLQEIRIEQEKYQAKLEDLNAKYTCNQKAFDSIQDKIKSSEQLRNEYGYMKDLENAAKGNNKEKVVFEHYVLAAYFEDILYAANLRFRTMTNERYEMRKIAKVIDQRTKNSLDLEVFDSYTGKCRPIRSLSGGESFKAALSLALGLADIIQQNSGGIEVDTLFIDEGFGSLDSESLEQALKALMQLTGNNKLIGLISHVNELKERIDEQIVIERDQRGSKLKVVV